MTINIRTFGLLPNGKSINELRRYLALNSHVFASLVLKFIRPSFQPKIKIHGEGQKHVSSAPVIVKIIIFAIFFCNSFMFF